MALLQGKQMLELRPFLLERRMPNLSIEGSAKSINPSHARRTRDLPDECKNRSRKSFPAGRAVAEEHASDDDSGLENITEANISTRDARMTGRAKTSESCFQDPTLVCPEEHH